MLRGAEGDLAADAAGGAGDDDHAARQEGRAAHDRGRRRGVQFALREQKRLAKLFLHFDKTTTLETGWKVAMCRRVNQHYMRIYSITDQMLL